MVASCSLSYSKFVFGGGSCSFQVRVGVCVRVFWGVLFVLLFCFWERNASKLILIMVLTRSSKSFGSVRALSYGQVFYQWALRMLACSQCWHDLHVLHNGISVVFACPV